MARRGLKTLQKIVKTVIILCGLSAPIVAGQMSPEHPWATYTLVALYGIVVVLVVIEFVWLRGDR